MALTTVSFTTSYDYTNGVFVFTDTSDYAGQGVSTSNVLGNFEITDPNGTVVWNNTDFSTEVGTAQSGGASSITLAVGASATNNYYNNLYIYIISGTGNGQYRRVSAYNGTTKVATLSTAWSVVPDNTSGYGFAFSDIYPRAVLTNQGLINLSLGVDGSPLEGNYSITYTVKDTNTGVYVTSTSSYAFSFIPPVPSLGFTIDCISPQLIATDTTNYVVDNVVPTITRTHTLYYPPSLNILPITGTVTDIATSNFYTPATFEHTLSAVCTWDFGTYQVTVTLTSQQFINVTCDAQLCDIYCCVSTLYNNWKANVGVNNILAERYLAQLVQVASLMTLIKQAIECGKNDAVAGYVSDILRIANCEAGCGCTADAPIPVTGLGTGTNTITTLTAGNGVTITSTTTGSTTDYVVSISNSLMTTISSLHNQVVTGSVSNTVTYNGGTFTYNVQGADVSVSADTYKPTGTSILLTPTTVGGIDTNWDLKYVGRKAGLLFLNETPVPTTSNALQDLMTYTPSGLPANTLAVDGDELIIRAYFSFADTATKLARLIAYLDFGAVQAVYSNWSSAVRKCQIEMRVVRIDDTHIKREVVTCVMDASGAVAWASNINTSASVVVPSLLGNAVTIKTEGDGQAAADISCDYLTVELIPKI